MNKNAKLLVGLALVAAAIAIMVLSTMPEAGSKEVTIGEITTNHSKYQDEYVMTQGLLTEGSIKWDADDTKLEFSLSGDNGEILPVSYNGAKPDNFSDDVIVIVEGFYQKNGTFEAEKVQTKCPSKYEGEDMENYDKEKHKQIYSEKQGEL